jgi:hypothetical protein
MHRHRGRRLTRAIHLEETDLHGVASKPARPPVTPPRDHDPGLHQPGQRPADEARVDVDTLSDLLGGHVVAVMVVAEDRDDVKPHREAGVGRRHNVRLISTVASGKSVCPPGWHIRRCPACSVARADGHTRRRRREVGAERRRWPRVARFGDGRLPRHGVLAPPGHRGRAVHPRTAHRRPVGVMVFGCWPTRRSSPERKYWRSHTRAAGDSASVVSSRATPSPPCRCRAARRTVAATRFTTVPETQRKRSSPYRERDLTCAN